MQIDFSKLREKDIDSWMLMRVFCRNPTVWMRMGVFKHLRSAKKAAKRLLPKIVWEIHAHAIGDSEGYYIPWSNESGRIEWPPSK